MPDDPKNPDSLGDDRTFVGERDTPVESEPSLGDEGTHAGGMDSSLSDLKFDGQAVDSDLPLIDLASRYELEGELGKGGMGEIQLATDRQLKRKVAIKRIHASSQSALNRFITEAQSIAALNHFNIVQIHDFGRDAEGPLLVMEYVSGGSLLDRLKEGKLEVEDAISITCQLCDALALAHGKGIIHRDIKPANILLTEEGVPKLTDFGLARQDAVDHGQTQAGAVLGTIDFMSPEQRRDATSVDARSDLWSLAASLYQMITGSSPKVIRLDQLPANLAPVIGTMLEENPDKRYTTAEQFKTELRKGMAAAAAPVAVDLAAGVCPACDTANDSSRKFCRGCGDSLRVPCLACKADVPVWEKICGECGCKQDEQRELIREKLAATIEEGLTLAREYEFEKALEQLNTVAKDPHAFNEDLRGQATEQIELVTVQQDEQYQLRDQLVQLAKQHQQAHDYVAVVKELEKIPAPLRSGNPIAEQLSVAQSARDELSSLLQQMGSDIKNSRFDGLMEKTTRILELNPKHDQVQKLHEQLLERQQQADDQTAELLGRAEQQYNQGLDEAVLETVANWPQTLQQPARVEQLQKMATDRLACVQVLEAQISAATETAGKQSLVEKILQLRPGDQQAQQLAESLGKQRQGERRQQKHAEKKNRRTKKMFIAAWVLAAIVMTTFSWWMIRSSNKEQAAIAQVAERVAAERVAAERIAAVKKLMTPAQLALGDPVVNSVGMLLVPIPAGEFQMGSPAAGSDASDREKPQHLVKITKPFYLGVYEVTQQQYEKVMGARPWQGRLYVRGGADYPAVPVSHDDAVGFCRRLSKLEGVEYRLPTEAEWEYACRAGTTTAYSFGDDEAKLGQYAWYEKNAWDIGEKYAHGVGQKLPNPWGLYDMHGNVYEWCQDWYVPYGSEKVVSDPVGPAQGRIRVLRGGSFSLPSSFVRSAYRYSYLPANRILNAGFRAARTYNLSP